MSAEDELRDTVERMETKLNQSSRQDVILLLRHYQSLCARFQFDLDSEYKVYLARASALMLIQSIEQSE